MQNLKNKITRTPILGRTVLAIFRAKTAVAYFNKPLINMVKWLFKSKETTNFTYDLEEHNKRYLASLIAHVLNTDFFTIMNYIREVEEDEEFKKHIEDMTASSDMAFIADKEVRLGRRIGWYAFARAIKPKIIIETGVDKGLGSCVLTAALKRNKQEGFEGKYYGTDINPKAGYLLSGAYANFGSILYGDSIGSLTKFDGMIDLFINDSDHSADYEAQEYVTIVNKLSNHAIVLGDNSHCTDKLFCFALATHRHFIFFQEKPSGHWYPGAGIGICFSLKNLSQSEYLD
jgi:predicted O-methyltransferase YrrM